MNSWLWGLAALGVLALIEREAEVGRATTELGLKREYARKARARDRLKAAGGDAAAARRVAADEARLRKQAARAERIARARSAVSCCDAPSDSWRESREVYDAWLPPEPMSWEAAGRACFDESRSFAAMGDYSKPASRRCKLGKLHQSKLTAWNNCRAECGGQALREDGRYHWSVAGREGIMARGGMTFYLRSDGVWWVVETDDGFGGYVEVDRWSTEDEARADIEARLSDELPF